MRNPGEQGAIRLERGRLEGFPGHAGSVVEHHGSKMPIAVDPLGRADAGPDRPTTVRIDRTDGVADPCRQIGGAAGGDPVRDLSIGSSLDCTHARSHRSDDTGAIRTNAAPPAGSGQTTRPPFDPPTTFAIARNAPTDSRSTRSVA